eukprot:3042198-Rhodomonas_salina.1
MFQVLTGDGWASTIARPLFGPDERATVKVSHAPRRSRRNHTKSHDMARKPKRDQTKWPGLGII